MGYCNFHGDHSGRNCPDCQRDDYQQQEELIQAVRDSSSSSPSVDLDALAYKINNPGEWECPYCSYFTLIYGASRCPKCHATMSGEYYKQFWREVDEVIKEDEEEERRRQQRARADEEEEEKRTKLAEEKRKEEERVTCFVATVCFGDFQAPEVVILRAWRDKTLSRFFLGRSFIRMYYSGLGEICAHWIENKDILKKILRKALQLFIYYGGVKN